MKAHSCLPFEENAAVTQQSHVLVKFASVGHKIVSVIVSLRMCRTLWVSNESCDEWDNRCTFVWRNTFSDVRILGGSRDSAIWYSYDGLLLECSLSLLRRVSMIFIIAKFTTLQSKIYYCDSWIYYLFYFFLVCLYNTFLYHY